MINFTFFLFIFGGFGFFFLVRFHSRILSKHGALINFDVLIALTNHFKLILEFMSSQFFCNGEQSAAETHFLNQVLIFLILYDWVHRYLLSWIFGESSLTYLIYLSYVLRCHFRVQTLSARVFPGITSFEV